MSKLSFILCCSFWAWRQSFWILLLVEENSNNIPFSSSLIPVKRTYWTESTFQNEFLRILENNWINLRRDLWCVLLRFNNCFPFLYKSTVAPSLLPTSSSIFKALEMRSKALRWCCLSLLTRCCTAKLSASSLYVVTPTKSRAVRVFSFKFL